MILFLSEEVVACLPHPDNTSLILMFSKTGDGFKKLLNGPEPLTRRNTKSLWKHMICVQRDVFYRWLLYQEPSNDFKFIEKFEIAEINELLHERGLEINYAAGIETMENGTEEITWKKLETGSGDSSRNSGRNKRNERNDKLNRTEDSERQSDLFA